MNTHIVKINITTHCEGCIHVSFSCAQREVFDRVLELFKTAINTRLRSYDREGRVFNLRPEARPALNGWLLLCDANWHTNVEHNDERSAAHA